MKFLGWMLLLSVTGAHAQAVIESAPLSIEQDGARKINDGSNPAPVVKEGPKEVIKIEAVEVKPESLESVDATTKKTVKKESKKSKKAAAAIIVQKKTEVVAPAPVVVAEPSEALKEAPPQAVNPADGQLKLDGPKATANTNDIKIEDKKPEASKEAKRIDDRKVITPVATKTETETIAVVYYEETLKKYLQFSFGYLNSKYEKIHPNLDNGSTITSFSFVSDMTRNYQTGFTVEMLSDHSDQKIPDNIRVVQYRLFVNYHAPVAGSQRFDYVGGLSLSVGDYGIRRRYINLQGEEASVKLKDGTIFGLIPAAGVRIYLVGRNSIDLMVEYHQYFGSAQSHIGGLAFNPRFSFEF